MGKELELALKADRYQLDIDKLDSRAALNERWRTAVGMLVSPISAPVCWGFPQWIRALFPSRS